MPPFLTRQKKKGQRIFEMSLIFIREILKDISIQCFNQKLEY